MFREGWEGGDCILTEGDSASVCRGYTINCIGHTVNLAQAGLLTPLGKFVPHTGPATLSCLPDSQFSLPFFLLSFFSVIVVYNLVKDSVVMSTPPALQKYSTTNTTSPMMLSSS